ncbi:MAG: 2OG-Fe(II) oxygenase [Burkholderiales bacterium]|nr:2OG-Fe(II) oxygenase [Burkholderiales bacterium]
MNVHDLPETALSVINATFPLGRQWGTCLVIPGFLTHQECKEMIAKAETAQFSSAATDYPPSYRNNERLVVDDESLARRLFERLQGRMPQSLASLAAADGAVWQMEAINERIRFCRYCEGQEFNVHQDGVHYRGPNRQSKLTFMIYLTDGGEFSGGDTVFYAAGPGIDTPPEIGRVRPRAGSLIIFDHEIWHAGAPVTAGVKHIMRSDLIYRRESALAETHAAPFTPSHQGYIWTMARLNDGRIASGGRDQTIRLWTPDGKPSGSLVGHERSVLGLTQSAPGYLASASRDRTLRFWNLETGACEKTVHAHEAAILNVISLKNGSLLTAAADHLIKIWRSDGSLAQTFHGHEGWVWAVAELNADLMASASEDGAVKIWATENAQCLQTFAAAAPLRCLGTNCSQALMAAGDVHGTVHLWSIESSKVRPESQFLAHDAAVRCIAFLGENVLATSGEDKKVKLWDLNSGKLLQQAEHDNFVTAVLPTGRNSFLSCSYDGYIRAHRAGSP